MAAGEMEEEDLEVAEKVVVVWAVEEKEAGLVEAEMVEEEKEEEDLVAEAMEEAETEAEDLEEGTDCTIHIQMLICCSH